MEITGTANGLEFIIINNISNRPKEEREEVREERAVIKAGSKLMSKLAKAGILKDYQVLPYKDAKECLDGSDNYKWIVGIENGKAHSLAVTDRINIGKDATIGMIWYLMALPEMKEKAANILIDIAIDKSNEARYNEKYKFRDKKDLGIFIDDVPNCTDVAKKNGFRGLPFPIYVSSLEKEANRNKIVGEVHPLILPGVGRDRRVSYDYGFHEDRMKEIVREYLWQGYESNRGRQPYKETIKELEKTVVNGTVPFVR